MIKLKEMMPGGKPSLFHEAATSPRKNKRFSLHRSKFILPQFLINVNTYTKIEGEVVVIVFTDKLPAVINKLEIIYPDFRKVSIEKIVKDKSKK